MEWHSGSNISFSEAPISHEGTTTFYVVPASIRRNAQMPYQPSLRSCTDVVPIQRTCFPTELTSMRKARSVDPIDTFEVVLILRKSFPLTYSPQCGEVLQSMVIPARTGASCSSPSGEVDGTTPAGQSDSPLSSLSSCGEVERTSPMGRPDSLAPNPSDKADRTTHPGPSDSSMSNPSSVSSMQQISTSHEPAPLTSVPARFPSGAAPMLTESVSVTRTSTKICGVDQHFTLFLSTGNRPLTAPDPVMLANSGDLYLHQHHLNTQIWVKEASGWVVGCGKMTDCDPSTGNEVTGLYVTAPVYKTHARNDKQLTLSGASPSMAKSRVRESTREQQEEKILAETLFHPGHTDTLVSAPYNDAHRVHKTPGAQRDPTVLSDGSNKLTDCAAESLLPDSQGVIPNQNSLKISWSHAILDRLEKRLSLLKKNFRYPSLMFPKDPNSVTDPLPQLLFTSQQQSSNMEFLTHQDQIAMLASEADIIQTHWMQWLRTRNEPVHEPHAQTVNATEPGMWQTHTAFSMEFKVRMFALALWKYHKYNSPNRGS
ncbi:hypothetical protein EDD15DRAFT_2197296 [Pisolithus albus]|nr:hypothetical protein EDD15DRAFT_2197296 [Pisolithus albus]